MSRSSVALALIAAALLGTSCATPKPDRPPRTVTVMAACHWTDCEIAVNVTPDCNVSVNYPELKVIGPRKINWRLYAPAGYSFAASGIDFRDKQQFECERLSETHFACKDKGKKGRYKYDVNIDRSGATSCKPLDPYIYNQ